MSKTLLPLALVFVLMFGAFTVKESQAAASLVVEVVVEGHDGSGGIFWVVVLPADIRQPVQFEDVRPFTQPTQAGILTVNDLTPGRYVIALIITSSEMRDEPEHLLAVQALEGIGYWPAVEVEINADEVRSIVFVREEYPPIPEGFIIPYTSQSTFEAGTSQDVHGASSHASDAHGTMLSIGLIMIFASIVIGISVFLYDRRWLPTKRRS